MIDKYKVKDMFRKNIWIIHSSFKYLLAAYLVFLLLNKIKVIIYWKNLNYLLIIIVFLGILSLITWNFVEVENKNDQI
ncbi:hypothetical protein J4216_04385 [Candidatus Woesearchaeota archaeon]|nr:hypothetical protein [Candidatus Woesearchaeota archaeon]